MVDKTDIRLLLIAVSMFLIFPIFQTEVIEEQSLVDDLNEQCKFQTGTDFTSCVADLSIDKIKSFPVGNTLFIAFIGIIVLLIAFVGFK